METEFRLNWKGNTEKMQTVWVQCTYDLLYYTYVGMNAKIKGKNQVLNKPVDLNATEPYNAQVSWPNSYLFFLYFKVKLTCCYNDLDQNKLLPKGRTMEQWKIQHSVSMSEICIIRILYSTQLYDQSCPELSSYIGVTKKKVDGRKEVKWCD